MEIRANDFSYARLEAEELAKVKVPYKMRLQMFADPDPNPDDLDDPNPDDPDPDDDPTFDDLIKSNKEYRKRHNQIKKDAVEAAIQNRFGDLDGRSVEDIKKLIKDDEVRKANGGKDPDASDREKTLQDEIEGLKGQLNDSTKQNKELMIANFASKPDVGVDAKLAMKLIDTSAIEVGDDGATNLQDLFDDLETEYPTIFKKADTDNDPKPPEDKPGYNGPIHTNHKGNAGKGGKATPEEAGKAAASRLFPKKEE